MNRISPVRNSHYMAAAIVNQYPQTVSTSTVSFPSRYRHLLMDCIQDQMMSKQADSHSRRKNTRQNRAEPPALSPHVPGIEGSGVTAQLPTQPLVAITNTAPAAQPALLSEADAVEFLRQLGPEFLSQFSFPPVAANGPQLAPLAASGIIFLSIC